jgi:hypothetical protein
MIVGGYNLNLYCDGAPDCKNRSAKYDGGDHYTAPGKYVGETGSECRQQDRKRGWILNLQENTAVCPKCAKKGFLPGPAPGMTDHIIDEGTEESEG